MAIKANLEKKKNFKKILTFIFQIEHRKQHMKNIVAFWMEMKLLVRDLTITFTCNSNDNFPIWKQKNKSLYWSICQFLLSKDFLTCFYYSIANFLLWYSTTQMRKQPSYKTPLAIHWIGTLHISLRSETETLKSLIS